MHAQREEMSEKLQNVRLEIVTAKKDIEGLNSEIAYALSSEEGRESRKAELYTQIDNYPPYDRLDGAICFAKEL